MKVEFSPRSVADLREILEYVAQHNAGAAVRLIDGIEKACAGLSSMPRVGTKRDDLAPGLLALSHGAYVIYFVEQAGHSMRIIRVLHGARDIRPVDFRPQQP